MNDIQILAARYESEDGRSQFGTFGGRYYPETWGNVRIHGYVWAPSLRNICFRTPVCTRDNFGVTTTPATNMTYRWSRV